MRAELCTVVQNALTGEGRANLIKAHCIDRAGQLLSNRTAEGKQIECTYDVSTTKAFISYYADEALHCKTFAVETAYIQSVSPLLRDCSTMAQP